LLRAQHDDDDDDEGGEEDESKCRRATPVPVLPLLALLEGDAE